MVILKRPGLILGLPGEEQGQGAGFDFNDAVRGGGATRNDRQQAMPTQFLAHALGVPAPQHKAEVMKRVRVLKRSNVGAFYAMKANVQPPDVQDGIPLQITDEVFVRTHIGITLIN